MERRRLTLKDIASRVGVSATVVSQVLRGLPGTMVSQEKRERILQVAQELGYRPNRQAQALVGAKTHAVALWKHDLHSAFHAWVIHEFFQRACGSGYEVLVRDFGSVREESVWVFLEGVDGVIVHECPVHLQILTRERLPLVIPLVNAGVFYVTACDYVGVDLYPAAQEAVQHLLTQGCKRVAYVAPHANNAAGEPRYKAYQSVLHEAGIAPEVIVVGDAPRCEARKLFREYCQQHGAPEGIVCCNDDMAITCLRALYDLNLRVPDDVALVGCDGIEATEYTCPEISTIVQPIEEMCGLAWDLLVRRIDQPDKEVEGVVLPARFVARGSSRRNSSVLAALNSFPQYGADTNA